METHTNKGKIYNLKVLAIDYIQEQFCRPPPQITMIGIINNDIQFKFDKKLCFLF